MRVLSADPGYGRLGVAVLEKEGSKEVLIYSDCIQTSKELSYADRLLIIGTEFTAILNKFSPDAFASESLFFVKNQKTAIGVAGVRGMLFYIIKQKGLSVYEYTPLQVKIAMTGYGRSDKKQIADMVTKLININKKIKFDDEYDAIAIGLTCLASERL